ncbi:N-acetyl-gamma-glutamyl-phosphate reductase [Mucisphaera sp.]|uniref:N-acetyl-gamma-glutamyl-phosphate reductase n=1 Tax=Mucisphaera sp. TaxID=2913024 RepID=UPI003D11253C
MTLRAAIVGPTGYAGAELIRLLLGHPGVALTYLASHREELPDLRVELPRFAGVLPEEVAVARPIDYGAMAEAADVVFLGLPHTASMAHVPGLLAAGLRVVDLSADYRLPSAADYEAVYGVTHTDGDRLAGTVYGLPELFRDRITGATDLVASPGCYPTAALLGLTPLVRGGLIETDDVVINAASGTTGAGRSPKVGLLHAEANEGYAAYGKIGGHRHQPEIGLTLGSLGFEGVDPLFVPHLLPVDRGILETIYCTPAEGVTEADVAGAYAAAYGEELFVDVVEHLPSVKHVAGTNRVQIAFRWAETQRSRKLVVFVTEDNIVKGASGQAVQAMNLMFGLEEGEGLLGL